MNKIAQILIATLMISTLVIASNAANQDQRITLKNGKSQESVTLNPSRTYRFLINAKEFSKLSINLSTKGSRIKVAVKSPKGKTITSGTGTSFTIQKAETGDYQIILKNIGDSPASVSMKIGDIKGEATE